MIEITDEAIESIIKDYRLLLAMKIKQKGRFPFNSPLEIMGKIEEEKYEVLMELHNKKWKKDPSLLENELLDLANVCLWGVLSMRANRGQK